MKKELKDYLHLYIGSPIRHKWSETVQVLTGQRTQAHWILLLRPLSSITEKEAVEIFNSGLNESYCGDKLAALMHIFSDEKRNEDQHPISFKAASEITRVLLKIGFDLFGLIEAGLAIERKEVSDGIH